MSKRESGILAVSHRCSSLHLLFSFIEIISLVLGEHTTHKVAVFAETAMFLLPKSCIHKKRSFYRFRIAVWASGSGHWRTATGGRLRIAAIYITSVAFFGS